MSSSHEKGDEGENSLQNFRACLLELPTDEEDLEIRILLICSPRYSDIRIHSDEQVQNKSLRRARKKSLIPVLVKHCNGLDACNANFMLCSTYGWWDFNALWHWSPLKLSTKCVSGSKTGCICLWGDEIRMNGYLFTKSVIRMSEYSDICWNLYLQVNFVSFLLLGIKVFSSI